MNRAESPVGAWTGSAASMSPAPPLTGFLGQERRPALLSHFLLTRLTRLVESPPCSA